MTDGIIQEVFNSVRKGYIYPLTYDDLDFVEQELIEKIKQESSPDTPYYESMITRRKLIGDNQE